MEGTICQCSIVMLRLVFLLIHVNIRDIRDIRDRSAQRARSPWSSAYLLIYDVKIQQISELCVHVDKRVLYELFILVVYVCHLWCSYENSYLCTCTCVNDVLISMYIYVYIIYISIYIHVLHMAKMYKRQTNCVLMV